MTPHLPMFSCNSPNLISSGRRIKKMVAQLKNKDIKPIPTNPKLTEVTVQSALVMV